MFREGDTDFLLEPLARERDNMVRPLMDVRADYIPRFGADRRGRTVAYAAYVHEMWSDPASRSASRSPQN
jgi:hypothetical protein